MSDELREPSRSISPPPNAARPKHTFRKTVIFLLAAFGTLSAAFFIGSMIFFNWAESVTLEDLEQARTTDPALFLGISEDKEPWLQLLLYRSVKERILEEDPQPERLLEGESIYSVQQSLGVYPVLIEEFVTDGIELKQIAWEIEPERYLITNFRENKLIKWAMAQGSIQESARSLAEIEEEVYPMSAAAQIRSTLLIFDLYDNFNYMNATFIITSGGEMYWYELEFLPSPKRIDIELDEFSQDGRRFSPYSYVVDTLSVVATRPDGYRALFMMVFTGNTRK